MSNDNVIPFKQSLPPTEEPTIMKMEGGVYNGASRAVAQVLREGNFDKSVEGIGPVEIRMIAEFTATGCIFHNVGVMPMQAQHPLAEATEKVLRTRHVEPSPDPVKEGVDAVAMMILRFLASYHQIPQGKLMEVATVSQLDLLVKQLSSASMGDIIKIVTHDQHPEEAEELLTELGANDVLTTLSEIMEAYRAQ